jgi:Fe2+ transport system protein FeoA
MGKTCQLSEMEAGTSAVIRSLPEGLPSLARLREMGLLPGTRLTFVRRAPLGDPLEFMVRGALLSLRGTEASLITVEVQP